MVGGLAPNPPKLGGAAAFAAPVPNEESPEPKVLPHVAGLPKAERAPGGTNYQIRTLLSAPETTTPINIYQFQFLLI